MSGESDTFRGGGSRTAPSVPRGPARVGQMAGKRARRQSCEIPSTTCRLADSRHPSFADEVAYCITWTSSRECPSGCSLIIAHGIFVDQSHRSVCRASDGCSACPRIVIAVARSAGAGCNVPVGARNRHRPVNRRPGLPQLQIRHHTSPSRSAARFPCRCTPCGCHSSTRAVFAGTRRMSSTATVTQHAMWRPRGRENTAACSNCLFLNSPPPDNHEYFLVSQKLGLKNRRLQIHRTLIILGIVTADQRRTAGRGGQPNRAAQRRYEHDRNRGALPGSS